MSRPAIFLDRDGVIIENRVNYVRSWADVEVFPQAVEALIGVRHSPYCIVLVTNQSAVGRGLITYEIADAINHKLMVVIREAGARVDAIYMCPHAPQEDCDCRKPLPGLLLKAAEELDLDLSNSVMVGDALTDIQAGQAAGVRQSILVRTGRGRDQEQLLSAAERSTMMVFDTLHEALNDVLNPLP